MQALEGIRITDLSWLVSGAWGTRQLAGFGAEVIRVEWKSNLDSLRNQVTLALPDGAGPSGAAAVQPSISRSGMFNNTNAGKLGVAVNINHPKGKQVLAKLIAESDVVIENFTAGTMAKWGFSYPELKQIRPDIIYVQLPGYGTSGPYVDYRAYGLINQAFSGLTQQVGQPEPNQPCGWGYGYMDTMVGVFNSLAVMTALHHRNRTGEGQHIDLAQTEMGVYITGTAYLDRQASGRHYQRSGNRSPYQPAAPHGAYRCAGENNWVTIACFTEEQWQAFRRAIGEPEWTRRAEFLTLADRIAHQDELDAHIETWTRLHGKGQVMHLLQRHGAPAGAVLSPEELMEHDETLRCRDYLVWLEQSEAGMWPVERIAGTLSETPSYAGGRVNRASPMYGEDTDVVLKNILQYSDVEISQLRQEGVIE